MRLLIENATIVTMDQHDQVLAHGWIEVRDGVITAVSTRPLDRYGVDRRIDASGKVVMPGLVNAHTHLFQTLLRGVYENLPFREWLRSIYHCGPTLTADDCYIAAVLGSIEAVRSGVTTVVDHHFLNRGTELPEATIAGMRAVGVRTVLARTIMDESELAPAEVLESVEAGLRSVEDLLAAHRRELGDGMLTIMTGPNTPGVSASAALTIATQQFARRHGLRLSAHIAESRSVLEAVRRQYGADGVVAWLDSLGALGPELLAAHCVHLSLEEVQVLAQRGVSVVHNPVSNMFLGDGIAPVVEMLGAGVTVALGTDGAASNNSQDMFEVTKTAALLQRVHKQDAQAMPATQALRMATINGAKALGMDHLIGSLEPGKRADLVILDLHRAPHNVAVHNVVSHLVHCVKASDVEMVMVDGRILLEQGQVVSVDEPLMLHAAQQAADRLLQRLEQLA